MAGTDRTENSPGEVSAVAVEPIASYPAPARAILAPLPFTAAIGAADAFLLALKTLTGAPLALWFIAHAALVGAACHYAWRQRASSPDLTPYALALIASFIAGPAGAVLAGLALIVMAREPDHSELLTAWYDRIALAGDTDKATDLYNTVAMGRALDTRASAPPVFGSVMSHGSLADRQTALGLIARQFSPSYAPALHQALVSPEPVIRVQAAAVAVKVRAELKTALDRALERAGSQNFTPAEAAALAVELRAMVRSGLLEDDDRDRGAAVVQKLTAAAADTLAATNSAGVATTDPAAQALLETELLRRGSFQAFRDQRSRAAAAAAIPAHDKGVPHV